eukprot:4797771-Pyramimonas_sp.AAC.1
MITAVISMLIRGGLKKSSPVKRSTRAAYVGRASFVQLLSARHLEEVAAQAQDGAVQQLRVGALSQLPHGGTVLGVQPLRPPEGVLRAEDAHRRRPVERAPPPQQCARLHPRRRSARQCRRRQRLRGGDDGGRAG